MHSHAPTGSVGTSIPRLDGTSFVEGRAAYSADLIPIGALYVSLVRSPHARATITAIHRELALAATGVVAIVDGRELALITDPTPSRFAKDRLAGPLDVRSLAVGEVMYVGEPVIAVVATTAEDARFGVSQLSVDYHVRPAILDPREALENQSIVHAGWTTNVAVHDLIKEGNVEAAFASADVIVEDEISFDGSTSAPMEPRCYVAEWDSRAQHLTLTGTFQMPHPSRWAVAQALRLKESQVRVLAPNIGGTFGLKMVGHPEEVIVGALSMMLKRPVAFIEDRAECFLARGREQQHHFKIAATREGKITAFANRIVADVGVIQAVGGWQMGLVAASVFPSVYDVPNCQVECSLVTTNKAPWQGVRGYGKEIANLVMERAVDRLAAALGMDPVELRRKNLLAESAFPHRLPSGMLLDSGSYGPALSDLQAMLCVSGWPMRRRPTDDDTRAVGVGIAFELTPEGASFPGSLPSGFETSTVRLDPSGEIVVLASVTSPGGGNETGIAQLVADVFAVPPSLVRVLQGDTDISPFGAGNTSSRSLIFGGAAAVEAARDVAGRLAECGATLLETNAEDVGFIEGHLVSLKDRSRRIPFKTAIFAVYTQTFTMADKVELPLQATKSYKTLNVRHTPDQHGRISSYPSFPYSVHAAAVEVCSATGIVRVLDYAVVHDCGHVVNPSLVEGQIRGAVAMGIGAALWERMASDPAGHPIADRFKAYLLPRAPDLPNIRMGHRVTPSPFHPLGMKGAGESGLGGAMAATANAVADAIGQEAAARLRHYPLTPPRILAAMTGGSL